ncbi:MAG TPA: short-chain dehydrogenase, partial [Ramlibacter sp.]|nr:short-chain dehydrogenase [Ramlibacter sp.]
QVLGLHVGFIDTDMTRGIDRRKSTPGEVAARTLDALEAGHEEVVADEGTRAIKLTLGSPHAYYLAEPALRT